MKRLKLQSVIAAAVIVLGCVQIVDHFPAIVFAQSARVGGRDVPVTLFEQWFKRLGLLNTNAGCDVALEYDSLNVARVTDCTDTANLRDLKIRNGFVSTGLVIGGTAVGGAVSDYILTKEVTGIADATFTDVLTVTVPNAAESATIPIIINTRLGAGGAIGADECSGTAYGQVVVARTAGVNAVGTAVALSNAGSACVAGATTIATAYQLGSVTGAVGAVNTFTVQVRVTKGGGSSANHKVDLSVDILNAVAAGITVS